MKFTKVALYAAGGLITLAAIATLSAPKLRAAIRATLVEVVIPSKPFYDNLQLTTNAAKSLGPDTGALGVSNITVTNYDSQVQQVFIFAPVMSGACGSGTVLGGGTPNLQLYLQPHATLVVPFPTPLVFAGLEGHTCIAGQITTLLNGGSVEVAVTGFVN